MGHDQHIGLAREAILLALALAAPVTLAALLAALLVGVLDATTGIQQSSLGFAPRLAAGTVALVLSGPLVATELVRFFRVILPAMA